MDKTPQSLGIEYEILDLEGDLDGAPAQPRRLLDVELTQLSSGLFGDALKVEIPLETFFPPGSTLRPPPLPRFDSLAPASLNGRSDSLLPVEAEATPVSGTRRDGRWWGTMMAGVAMGIFGALIALRAVPKPHAPAKSAAVQAPVATAAASTTPRDTAAIPATKPSSPTSGTKPIAATSAKPARAAASAATPAKAQEAEPEAPAVVAAPAPAPAPAPAAEEASSGLSPQRAAVAVAAAARGTASCLDADDLRRTMAVSITFAPSGRVTRATIDGGPHRGTAAGSCIAQQLRSATVSPFEGAPVTVHTSIRVR